jgi:putative PIN family toxin of toxin-antitoxin system
LRCVFDTNVLVSSLLSPKSKPRSAFDRALTAGNILLCQSVFSELRGVLGRQHLRHYFDDEEVELFLDALIEDACWIEVSTEISACRDPKDDKFLSLAVSGGATHIVTGDKDLLVLDPFQGIRIVTPHNFLDLL